MKTLRAVNTLPELERLLQDVGSLVPLSVAAISLGVHNSRVYQLGESGRLRIFAVFGTYQTPLADVKNRINSKRRRLQMGEMQPFKTKEPQNRDALAIVPKGA
jgi:hypothetical protein